MNVLDMPRWDDTLILWLSYSLVVTFLDLEMQGPNLPLHYRIYPRYIPFMPRARWLIVLDPKICYMYEVSIASSGVKHCCQCEFPAQIKRIIFSETSVH